MFSSLCKSFTRSLRYNFSTVEELFVESFDGGIKVLVLNRYEGRNSFSRAMVKKVQIIK